MNTISKNLLLCGAGLAAALPASTWAQNELEEFPDIQYGLWETTTTTSMRSDVMNLPENTTTTRDCVTEEDVQEGRAFLQDQDNCEILEQDITSNSMDMVMECAQPESGAREAMPGKGGGCTEPSPVPCCKRGSASIICRV